MIIVRSVTMDDLEQLWDLIGKATYGLTTLQITKKQLNERLEHSHFAFNRETEKPSGEPYVFVMEDIARGKLVGVSSIFSKTGGFEPFYCFRIVTENHFCELLDRTQTVETLQLCKIHDGPTEIGSLFLDDGYRGKGRGRLLSLARFSFIATHRKRFADEVIAELRGWMSDEQLSPFWEGLGRLFFDMDFPQADILSTYNKRFIEDWIPKYPIYTKLLAPTVVQAIGRIHENSKPAHAMLIAEGFRTTDMIDIFDGGPTISCPTDQIDAVRRSQNVIVGDIQEQPEETLSIISSRYDGFRATLGSAVPLSPEKGSMSTVRISPLTAASLKLKIGQTATVTPLQPVMGVASPTSPLGQR